MRTLKSGPIPVTAGLILRATKNILMTTKVSDTVQCFLAICLILSIITQPSFMKSLHGFLYPFIMFSMDGQ
ncbi:hypothetical protein [Lysinibacillus sp. OL1]|uniref:hypothetical protein n=1 Tax=Lysinibacillus sp. OL1 TaxID=2517243 RepID=UPI001D100B79|nr:hypothetical protein [Lysinibacillus sp. OL1]